MEIKAGPKLHCRWNITFCYCLYFKSPCSLKCLLGFTYFAILYHVSKHSHSYRPINAANIYVTNLFFLLFLFQQISLLISEEYEVTRQDFIGWFIFNCVNCSQGLRDFFFPFFFCLIIYFNYDASISYNMKGIVLCMIILSDA